MSRGGGKKGAKAERGNTEKRGESIVILNRKYSGIKPKTVSESGSNQMCDVPKTGHKKEAEKMGIKKAPVASKRLKKYDYCQWSNISIIVG